MTNSNLKNDSDKLLNEDKKFIDDTLFRLKNSLKISKSENWKDNQVSEKEVSMLGIEIGNLDRYLRKNEADDLSKKDREFIENSLFRLENKLKIAINDNWVSNQIHEKVVKILTSEIDILERHIQSN